MALSADQLETRGNRKMIGAVTSGVLMGFDLKGSQPILDDLNIPLTHDIDVAILSTAGVLGLAALTLLISGTSDKRRANRMRGL